MKISIGDCVRGYDTAEVTKSAGGKYRLVPGTVFGRKNVVAKAIANVNRGQNVYYTSAGDGLSVSITER